MPRKALASVAAGVPVPFAPAVVGAREIAEVVATLESGWLSTGPRVATFEQAFARYTGADHAIALSSGSAALHLSLLAAGIGAGDDVVTTPLTFCATANAVVHAGARPVFADIDPATGNLDPAAAAAALTSRTGALLPVHFAGRPADAAQFAALARGKGLTVIEDAAHCIEGIAAGRKIGAVADFTCFSFHAANNLNTGEGGMVTTHDARAAEFIRSASLHGMTRSRWGRHAPGAAADGDVVMAGFKYNMMDIQAALGIHQLARITERHARRETIWAAYDAAFSGLPLRTPPPAPAGTRHARHIYTVLVDRAAGGVTRDELQARLRVRGVSTGIHFRALHLQPYYAERFGLRRGMFPAAEAVSDTTLSLPLSAGMTAEMVERVIEAVHDSLR